MISFENLAKLFSFDTESKRCIEIEFSVKGHFKYQSCWMGKMPDDKNIEKDLYWYGLVPDGSEAYCYDNFQDFFSAAVFDGSSLKDILDKVDLLSIDGCAPEDRLRAFL